LQLVKGTRGAAKILDLLLAARRVICAAPALHAHRPRRNALLKQRTTDEAALEVFARTRQRGQ